MSELKLTYGLDSNGRLVHVNDVHRGMECHCKCPECGAELVAKQGDRKKWHFAHANGADCEGALMPALHVLAQQIIKDEKKIRTPKYQGDFFSLDEENIVFSEVMLELQYQENDVNRRPDCVGIMGDEHLWIEVKVTHGIDSEKLANIKDNRISCIEIDLSSLHNKYYTEADIRNILFTDRGSDMREWINNPKFDAKNEMMREEFIQNLKNEIKIASQASLSFNQDQQQYPDHIIPIREELSYYANLWMKNGTKEAAEWVKYHIYHPYQDRDYVIHIEDFLVPNRDYLSFLVNTPKNQYTLDVFYAILDYDSRASISGHGMNIEKMETLLSELLKMSNHSEEDVILKEGLMWLQRIINPKNI